LQLGSHRIVALIPVSGLGSPIPGTVHNHNKTEQQVRFLWIVPVCFLESPRLIRFVRKPQVRFFFAFLEYAKVRLCLSDGLIWCLEGTNDSTRFCGPEQQLCGAGQHLWGLRIRTGTINKVLKLVYFHQRGDKNQACTISYKRLTMGFCLPLNTPIEPHSHFFRFHPHSHLFADQHAIPIHLFRPPQHYCCSLRFKHFHCPRDRSHFGGYA
jgi:hypothetical protein